jgi:hypothetical protein
VNIDCVREQDVFDAITSRRWPARVDEELRVHVASCAICADLVDVAAPLAAEQHVAWDDAVNLPPADVVYWRAQLRARAEASRRASLPIGFVQALSAATFAGVGATALGSAIWWLKSSWTAILSWNVPLPTTLPTLQPIAGLSVAVMALVACLILAPVTIYLLTTETGQDS